MANRTFAERRTWGVSRTTMIAEENDACDQMPRSKLKSRSLSHGVFRNAARPLTAAVPGICVNIPHRPPLQITHLVLDFTGTLSEDGALLPGVASRLRRLSKKVTVIVATADTFGTVRKALSALPVEIHLVQYGEDKRTLIESLAPKHVAAIGNGKNDIPMFGAASLSIAVLGPEGACAELLAAADIVVRDICVALDLLIYPLRIAATLRQ